MALSGGEDYQLLFSAPAEIVNRVSEAASYPIAVIGEMVAENAGQVMVMDGEGKRLRPQKDGPPKK